MTPLLKNFLKPIVLSITFLTIESPASELYVDAEILSFTLPSDLSLWQDATNSYMEPVLSTQALKDQWQILLDLTMPKHGNFDPTNPSRRETTIVQAFNKMLDLDDVNRLTYLNSLLNRHQTYVSK